MSSPEYWKKHYEAGRRMMEVAEKELGRFAVDDMLLDEEPETNGNWPEATDAGEYLDRTIPDVKGRDICFG